MDTNTDAVRAAAETAATAKHKILLVDDSSESLYALARILASTYEVRIATGGELALQLIARERPDLVLLDIVMPGMSGFDLLERLKGDEATREIPVVLVTSLEEDDKEERGLSLGAVDYIRKPFKAGIVRSRVSMQLKLKAEAEFLRERADHLALQAMQRNRELLEGRTVAIMTMVTLAEERDNETGAHMQRTQHYVRVLAEALRDHPRFRDYLTDAAIDILFKSAPLHDIGKVGISDSILLKPGRLTKPERKIMQDHPLIGFNAIKKAERKLGHTLDFLECAKEIIYSHHERWDGSGYPQGLTGDEIPIPARLMALADVYDALLCRRVYKGAMSHEEVTEIIAAASGSHFDPDVVTAFLEHEQEFRDIARRFPDWLPCCGDNQNG
ncbi:MAG: response regulator [Azoarcus sp.]|jgi:putative two-component system response regulator|nr:response regulator [Azoarcus sp.]